MNLTATLAAVSSFLLALVATACAQAFPVLDTGVPGRNEVYWLDNNRILFPGFEMRAGSNKRPLRAVLYVWNHETKRATIHADMAEGGYVCYSGGRVRYDVRRGEKLFFREGKLGMESEHEWGPPPPGARVDRSELNCRDVDLSEMESVRPGFLFKPLREKDGYLGWKRIDSIKEAHNSPLYYMPAGRGKNPIALPIKAGERGRVSYSEFLKAYVIEYTPGVRNDSTTGKVWLLYAGGRVEEITIPAGPWLRGSVGYTPAKPGVVLSSSALGIRSEEDLGDSGVYLVRGSKVERIIAGYPSRHVAVSPNGCKAAVVVRLRKPSAVKATLRVIDICRG